MSNTSLKKLSIIVPCLNEEGNIPRFQTEIFDFFSKFGFEKQYIFIDDGSSDNTLSQLQLLAQKHPALILIQHPVPQGLGSALISGIKESNGDAILVLDADLTFHPTEFPKLLEKFSSDVDCVTGSAFIGQFKGVSIFRRILSMSVNRIYSRLLGNNITSASSMFRLYRSEKLQALELESHGFDINAEIMAKLSLRGATLIEVPVVLTQRIFGQSKINFSREISNHLKLFFQILVWKSAMIKKT